MSRNDGPGLEFQTPVADLQPLPPSLSFAVTSQFPHSGPLPNHSGLPAPPEQATLAPPQHPSRLASSSWNTLHLALSCCGSALSGFATSWEGSYDHPSGMTCSLPPPPPGPTSSVTPPCLPGSTPHCSMPRFRYLSVYTSPVWGPEPRESRTCLLCPLRYPQCLQHCLALGKLSINFSDMS